MWDLAKLELERTKKSESMDSWAFLLNVIVIQVYNTPLAFFSMKEAELQV
ncbi:hypothetical protein LguiA_019329 [Lonicera macranthoides]